MIVRLSGIAALIPALGLAACSDQPAAPVDPNPPAQESTAVATEPAQLAETVEPDAAVTPPPEPEQSFSLLALDAGGLQIIESVEGKTRSIPFGADRAQVEAVLTKERGQEPTRGANAECGAGPMQFSTFGAYTANFQENRFVGWFLDEQEDQLKTTESIGIGSSRAALEAAMPVTMQEDSTIGVEFFSERGDDNFIGGLLSNASKDATITALYAGTNCFFR